MTWYVSAWWGQYESIYVLTALARRARGARRTTHCSWPAFLALSLMTKPQALPFIVPFAAWFLGSQGWRGTLKAAIVGRGRGAARLGAVHRRPNGPLNYLGNLRTYQEDIFSVLSLRAWNPWWIIQELGAGGDFVRGSDGHPRAGDVPARGARADRAAVGRRVRRRLPAAAPRSGWRSASRRSRSSRSCCLTTMHERYAYPAFVFLLLALPRPAVAIAWLAVRRHVRAQPASSPSRREGWTIPMARELGIVGGVVMTVLLGVVLVAGGLAGRRGPPRSGRR